MFLGKTVKITNKPYSSSEYILRTYRSSCSVDDFVASSYKSKSCTLSFRY